MPDAGSGGDILFKNRACFGIFNHGGVATLPVIHGMKKNEGSSTKARTRRAEKISMVCVFCIIAHQRIISA